MSDLRQTPISTLGVELEVQQALFDAEHHCIEYGKLVTFREFQEDNLDRDDYSSISQRITPNATLSIYAFSVDPTPNEERNEEFGDFEEEEIMIFTATKSWSDLGYNFKKIDLTRWVVIIDGEEFNVQRKQQYSQFSSSFLYYAFVLRKR